MANWIYLKKTGSGFDDIKASALASVLCVTSKTFNIVHTDVVSIYLKGIKNARIGNPCKTNGDIVVTLDLPDYAPFQILCIKISAFLNLKYDKPYKPYLGFVRSENEIDRQLSNKGDLILFCYYLNERELFLLSRLEEVVHNLDKSDCSVICCGSMRETLIKGAYDFRELIQIDEVIKNRSRIKLIVTAMPLVKEIGRLLGITVIFIYSYSYLVFHNKAEIVRSSLTNCVQKLTKDIIDICNDKVVLDDELKHQPIKKKFEVPYSFDEDIIPYYAHYSTHVNFLFLPPFYKDLMNTRTCLQSKVKGFSYMPQTRKEYEYHLNLITERKLRFVVLWQDRESVISKECLDYYSKLGASGFIIANDKNAQIIKEYNSKLLVISSIVQRLCRGISTKNFQYYDYCILFYPFTRSLDAIKQLSKLKDKLVIMPNSFCHTDCPGIQHWFVKDIRNFEFDKLCPAYNDNTKSTFIYPEHLYLFDNYVGGYKLQGREWSTDTIITACESYFNRLTPDTLVPPHLHEELQVIHKKFPLEEYYNVKTNEIIDLI